MKYKQCNYTDTHFHRAIKQYAQQNLIIKCSCWQELAFIKKLCEESVGHGCKTLLRVEACAHHVLTGTYDKRIITGLNCSY